MSKMTYNNYEVHYETAGNPANPCIICLHPAFGDLHVFDDQFSALSDKYFIIALDMLGHGGTQPEKTNDRLDAVLDHVKTLMGVYHVEKAHILGVSLGSLMAQGFAARYPESTLSVCAVGGYSIHKANQSLQKAQGKAIFSWLPKLLFNIDGFRRYIAQESTYKPHAREKMLTAAQAVKFQSMMYMQGMGKVIKKDETPVPYPLLIVYGDHDLEIALEHGRVWASVEPNARLEIIPDAGHCANMEQPQAFNKVYFDFLKSIA